MVNQLENRIIEYENTYYHFIIEGQNKGPNWDDLIRGLKSNYPHLPDQFPGIEVVDGRGDIGIYEKKKIGEDHQIGIDINLCGAK